MSYEVMYDAFCEKLNENHLKQLWKEPQLFNFKPKFFRFIEFSFFRTY